MNIDWYPLLNSLRIAAISCFLVFFTGIFFAYYAAKLPRAVKGVLDVVLTLPMNCLQRFAVIFSCSPLGSSARWGYFCCVSAFSS